VRAGLIVFACWGAVGGVARAEPPRIRLQAPAGCTSPDDLDERIADEERCDLAPAVVSVAIRRDGDVWRVRVRTSGGERELAGASCEEVAGAAALVVALGLECAPEHPPPAPRPWRAGGGLLVDGAIAPAWSGGVDLAGARVRGPIELRVDLLVVPPHAAPGPSTLTMHFEGAAASACAFIACAGLTAGLLGGHATASGFALGASVTAGLAYRVAAGPIDVRAAFDYALALTRPRFIVDSRLAYQPPLWGFRGVLSVEARFR
jgi:hypothetical protein